MTHPVKLYVYDLSNGLARQLSRQLTGRQIDGIWHTSVVVFGKEIFYGQGISITPPGRSHHGQPLEIIDMGETSIDEGTFDEYIEEIRQHYTADKYHLLEFNCNSFTDDCIGFLTGRSIPSHIKGENLDINRQAHIHDNEEDLPRDFLSTPFGAALRPTIDAMYRRPAPGAMPPPAAAAAASPNPALASSILQAVASQAQANGNARPTMGGAPATETLTSPVHIITNSASFNHLLKSNRATVAFFTSQTCGPCKMIEPVFDRLAEEKSGSNGAAFAKIDIDVGMGQALAAEWGIRATPTFIFFLDGKKLDELKGANANELRTQVDLLLFQAFPPHPHTSINVPAIQALSLNPIIFSQVPPIDTVFTKLTSFIDEQASWPESAAQKKEEVKGSLQKTVLPYLKARFQPAIPAPKVLPSATPAILTTWTQASVVLTSVLPVESLFPLVDLWRLAFLDPAVGSWTASLSGNPPTTDPISIFVPIAIKSQESTSKGARNYALTVLRLLCNAFSSPLLARKLLRTSEARESISSLLVPSLLHADGTVRTSAASLAFDVAAVLQKERVESVKSGKGIRADSEDDLADWEVEMVSALMEALDREKENEEVVHRLTAALAFFVRLSPHYESQVKPLLEVLQSKDILKSKLVKGDGWSVDGGLKKNDVRKLVEEVATKLCL